MGASSASTSPLASPSLSPKKDETKETRSTKSKTRSVRSGSGYSIQIETSLDSDSPQPNLLTLQLNSAKKQPNRKTSTASILSPREALQLSQKQARSPVFKAKRVTGSTSSDSLKEPPPPAR